jgi:hypothetical protein
MSVGHTQVRADEELVARARMAADVLVDID